MQVEVTTNYDRFKHLHGNRATVRQHVLKLGRVIAAKPESAANHPILVNEKFEVIDGQHRLVALKELGLPVHYIVAKGSTLEDVHVYNTNQRNWTPVDFAQSYAALGKKEYVDYLELRQRYGLDHKSTLSYMGAVAYASGEPAKGDSTARDFRQGRLGQFDGQKAVLRLERLTEAGEFVPFYQKRPFPAAFLTIQNHPQYDHSRMLRKLEEQGYTITRTNDHETYVRQLEKVYNHQFPTKNKVRFDYGK